MKKEIADKWCEMLESGVYAQGRGQLCTVEGGEPKYCCLGVLCELYQREVGDVVIGKDKDEPWILFYDDKRGSLPGKVQLWAGMKFPTGTGYDVDLTELNDLECLNFTEISQVIKKNVEIL